MYIYSLFYSLYYIWIRLSFTVVWHFIRDNQNKLVSSEDQHNSIRNILATNEQLTS
jgi:hypothetical protein